MLFGKYINKFYLRYAFFFILGIVSLIVVDWVQLYIPEELARVVSIFDSPEAVNFASDAVKSVVFEAIRNVLIVASIMFVGRVVWRLTIFYASRKIESKLRHQMFLKAEKLSARYYQENKVGTVMAWFTSDLDTINEFLGWGTIMLIDAFFLSVLTVFKMVRLDWLLSVICLAPVILIVIWGALVEKFMTKKWEERQASFDKLYDFSQENFTGIRVIKAFVKETKEIHAFAKVAKKQKDVNVGFARISIIFDVVIEIIIGLLILLLVLIGSWFVYCTVTGNPVNVFGKATELPASKLIQFISYVDILIWPMIALGQVVSMRSRAKGSLNRITNFLDQEEEIHNCENAIPLTDCKGEIEFRNLSFRYPSNDTDRLKNINLKINPGERVGIVGKIGCGKSTLVNLLLRLYNLEENTLLIDGVDIMKYDIVSLRDSIGYVPQDNFLFSDTIENNINFANRKRDLPMAMEGAQFANIHQDIDSMINKYDTISGERGVTLSGGQKQRISIARAYVKHAPIMILDDSVSAVDVKTEEAILHNIIEFRKNQTTLVVASRVSTVAHLDRIIVLNDGAVEAFDKPANLLKISPTYKRMVELQELEQEVEGGN